MTQNRNFKNRVRARVARTGESYASALRHLRHSTSAPNSIRLAVAQSVVRGNPASASELRTSGTELRRLMLEAREAGAKLIQFPEGATCWPHKRIMSVHGPEHVGAAEWGRFEWAVLREELELTCRLARELKLWTVFGAVHALTFPHRPHNSLYVVSDEGTLVTRYDERMLSNTKMSFMYSPGSTPVTFEIDGFRFGCSLGMEVHYPEIFLEYERLDVDCVLFSTAGLSPAIARTMAAEVQGHAASNACWVSFSVPAAPGSAATSGIAAPGGEWAARGPLTGEVGIALADITRNAQDPARHWRRRARAGLYAPHLIAGDSRSDDRSVL